MPSAGGDGGSREVAAAANVSQKMESLDSSKDMATSSRHAHDNRSDRAKTIARLVMR
jgi:hypothetical protein